MERLSQIYTRGRGGSEEAGNKKTREKVEGGGRGEGETVRYGTRWHGMAWHGNYQGMGYGILCFDKFGVLDCMVWYGMTWDRVRRDVTGWEEAGDGMGRDRGAKLRRRGQLLLREERGGHNLKACLFRLFRPSAQHR